MRCTTAPVVVPNSPPRPSAIHNHPTCSDTTGPESVRINGPNVQSSDDPAPTRSAATPGITKDRNAPINGTEADRDTRDPVEARSVRARTNCHIAIMDAAQARAMRHHAGPTTGRAHTSRPETITPTAVPALTTDCAVEERPGATTTSMIGTSAGEAKPPPMPPMKTAMMNSAGSVATATLRQPMVAVTPARIKPLRGAWATSRAASVAARAYEVNWAPAAHPSTGSSSGRSAARYGAKSPTPKRAIPYVAAISSIPATASPVPEPCPTVAFVDTAAIPAPSSITFVLL